MDVHLNATELFDMATRRFNNLITTLGSELTRANIVTAIATTTAAVLCAVALVLVLRYIAANPNAMNGGPGDVGLTMALIFMGVGTMLFPILTAVHVYLAMTPTVQAINTIGGLIK